MPIEVKCPCGAAFRVKDDMAGRKGKCPKCGGPITVPSAQDLELMPTTAVGLARPRHPPCPACGTIYPPEVLICTRCGIELATGQFVGAASAAAPGAAPGARAPKVSRQPVRTRAGQAAEEKSFWLALGQVFYNPLEAFDALGFYLLNNPANVGLVIGLYFVGTMLTASWEAIADRARGGTQVAATPEVEEPTEEPAPELRMARGEKIVENEFYAARIVVTGRSDGLMGASVWYEQKKDFAEDVRPALSFRPIAGSGTPPIPLTYEMRFGGTIPYNASTKDVGALVEEEDFQAEVLIERIRDPNGAKEVVGTETFVVPVVFEEPEAEEKEGESETGVGIGETVAMMGFGMLMVLKVVALVVLLAIKAVFVDVIARLMTGASRLLQIGIVLLFLDGVVGLVNSLLLLSSAVLPWDVVFMIGMVLPWWGYALYLVAIMKTYDIPGIFAFAIAVGTWLLKWLCGLGLAGIVIAIFLRSTGG